ncbi:hypothetical protein MXC99_11925 [Thauera aromatica]|uniref:hypothetical protein n=1 Tax=Thauera aromatica TaxID=59405 RepID=UPI001FFC5625|nr:hypothetical protein [Thauera aromatica]MCK2088878.1 hypothetical protein [Thauera aromatica]
MIFPCPAQAPEIFQIPLDDLDPAGLPPRGTPEFEQTVIGRYALDYAARGWQAVVAVDDAFARTGRAGEALPFFRQAACTWAGAFAPALIAAEAAPSYVRDPAFRRGLSYDRAFRGFTHAVPSISRGSRSPQGEPMR